MNEVDLMGRLRAIDTPIEPSTKFADQLFGTLTVERKRQQNRRRRFGFERPQLLQMAGATLAVLAIVAIGFALVGNPRGPSGTPIVVASPTPPPTTLPSPSTPASPTPSPSNSGPWRSGGEPPFPFASFLSSNDGLVWALGYAEAPAPFTLHELELMSYEASSDEWTDHGRITYEAGGLYPDDYSGLIGPDGDIYLFRVGLGGSEPPVVWKIDGETLTAESSPEVANEGATAIIAPNGTMYVLETVGGDTPDWQPQRLWAYDPAADVWELLPAIPEDRVNSLLVADADSDVLVIGGSTVPVFTSPDTAESTPLNTSFRYRPDVNSWSGDAAAPLNARADHLENPAALGADDAIYVMTRNGIGSPRLQGLAAGATTWTAVPTPSSVPDPLALSHVFASSAGQLVLMGRPDVVVVANLDALPDGS